MLNQIHLTPAEWEPIFTAGSGVLFRAGECECRSCLYGNREHPPAEFVEATRPCETCEDPCCAPGFVQGAAFSAECVPCPDCLDGKRRVAVVVPCNCTICDMRVRSTHPLITVGHVVVTFGPDPVVQYGEHATVGSYVVVLVEPGSRKAFRVENRRLPVEQHSLTLPPDVDPQSLVGQYAIGVEVAT